MTFPSQAQFMATPSRVWFYDTFSGPAVNLVDHDADIDIDEVGTAWTVIQGGTSTYGVGGGIMTGNPASPGIVVCDTGISNLKYTIDILQFPALGKYRYHFRVEDNANFLAVDFDRNNSLVTLDEVVAGAPNQLRQISRAVPNTFSIKIVARGQLIQVEETFPTRTVLVQGVSSQFLSATQCGFGENGGGGGVNYEMDNFRIERA